MAHDDSEAGQRRQRLMELLAPIHHQARLTARRLCRNNADGDDLFQEAALRALGRLSELREPTRFRAWFYAVLLSVHRQRSRRSFWRRFLPFEHATAPEPAHPLTAPADHWEEARGRAARVAQALARLPAVQREAVVLFEVDGFTIEEIAAMQGGSVAAVKSRLLRGRARLRQHYEALAGAEQEVTPRRKEVCHG